MNETIITQAIPVGYVPSYFLYIVVGILLASFIGLTYAYKSKKVNWGNFWMVIIFSVVIIAMVVTFLVSRPEMFVDWIIKIKEFIWV